MRNYLLALGMLGALAGSADRVQASILVAPTDPFQSASGDEGLAHPPVVGRVDSRTVMPIDVHTRDDLHLAGQLSVPAGKGPFPAVLMLVGSGPVDRYENVPGGVTADGKPALLFQGVEDALLARGFAVMMYDKRGVTPKDNTFIAATVDAELWKTATANNLAADALAAYDVLAANPNVDPARILILGHSEGTALALQVAEQRPAMKGLLMLGLFTRSLAAVLHYQDVDNEMRMFRVFNSAGDGYLTKDEIAPFLNEPDPPSVPFDALDRTGDWRVSDQEFQFAAEQQHKAVMNQVQAGTNDMVAGFPRLWFSQYFAMGPLLGRLAKFCTKIHDFQGESDVQTPFIDALELYDSCSAAGTPLAGFHHYLGLGHAFSPRIGLRQWRDTIGPMDPKVPGEIADAATTEVEAH